MSLKGSGRGPLLHEQGSGADRLQSPIWNAEPESPLWGAFARFSLQRADSGALAWAEAPTQPARGAEHRRSTACFSAEEAHSPRGDA